MIKVAEIKDGIVIDHICEGKGYKIFSQLGLDKLDCVAVLLRNVTSVKMGKKDLIKVETLEKIDLTVLGLIDPGVTINYIVDSKNIKKEKLQLPAKVDGILECKNPRCVCATEKIDIVSFNLADKEKGTYSCEFCGSITSL
ncbi:MAG: aspartate carbamoyltransferase regulatory subunit [Eubacteriaceae bacterium]|nr:aspartate carbamoyltransferase regulatory subunit [Eubacteriaceae bacterium]